MTVRKRYVIRILWNLLPFVQLNPHCFDLDLAGEELPLPVGVPATRRHRLVLRTIKWRIGKGIRCGPYPAERNRVEPH